MQPIFISDLIEVFVQAIEGDARGIVNVAGPWIVSIEDIARLAGRLLAREPIFVETAQEPSGDLVAETTRMHRQFALGPLIEQSEGLERTIAVRAAGI